MDIFPLMCAAGKVWITELTLIHKDICQFLTRMCQFIDKSDIKHIKTITSVLNALTDIITNIPARPIGLSEI